MTKEKKCIPRKQANIAFRKLVLLGFNCLQTDAWLTCWGRGPDGELRKMETEICSE